MKLERIRSQKHNIVIADDNLLFRRGLKGLLGAENDLSITGEAASEAELLVILERERADAVVAASQFLLRGGLFACHLSDAASSTPLVCLFDAENDAVSDLMQTALRIAKGEITSCLVRDLRALLRPEFCAQRQSSDLRALSRGSQNLSIDVLTAREKEVMRLLSDGLTVREAANELGLSTKTVESHTLNLMRKLDIHNRSGLIEYAISAGMLDQRVVA